MRIIRKIRLMWEMGFFPLWLKKINKKLNLSSLSNQNKYEIKIWQSLKSISQLNEVATPKLFSSLWIFKKKKKKEKHFI